MKRASAIVRHSLELQSSLDLPELLIEGVCPVPFFGDFIGSNIASVGFNPSNLEFRKINGEEISYRKRLPTLDDFKLKNWMDASDFQLSIITSTLHHYFEINPYSQWFDKLDRIFKPSGYSYYKRSSLLRACHIDLVPFATQNKWSSLKGTHKRTLISHSQKLFIQLLAESDINTIFLNGSGICNEFENAIGKRAIKEHQPRWDIHTKKGVTKGYSYQTEIKIGKKMSKY